MKAFGPYSDFGNCVERNSDKASPHGFCSWMHKQILGEWPTDAQSSMPAEAYAQYMTEYDTCLMAQKPEKEAHELALAKLKENSWFQVGKNWFQSYEAPKMRTILNVRVFESGEWTDSSGEPHTWTDAELDMMVAAFNAGVPAIVPLKAGHTPDDFNEEVAKELGISPKLVTGDLGNGQITLGRMISLERRGSFLMASFERVPEKLANLIEGGQFNTVSVEIDNSIEGYDFVMTGVALLGAEEPAVASASLDRAVVFGGKREGATVVSFAVVVSPEKLQEEFGVLQGKINEIIKGMKGAPVFRALSSQLQKLFDQITGSKHQTPIKSKEKETMKLTFMALKKLFQGEEITPQEAEQIPPEQVAEVVNDLVMIATALGLEDGAGIEEVMTAIEALKGGPGAGDGTPAEAMQKAFAKQGETIKDLTHDKLVTKYTKHTALLTHTPGKPEELAEDLAVMEENTSEEKTMAVLKTYQDADIRAFNVDEAIGNSRPGVKVMAFQARVDEYSKDNPTLARVECTKYIMNTEPALYRASVQESRR